MVRIDQGGEQYGKYRNQVKMWDSIGIKSKCGIHYGAPQECDIVAQYSMSGTTNQNGLLGPVVAL